MPLEETLPPLSDEARKRVADGDGDVAPDPSKVTPQPDKEKPPPKRVAAVRKPPLKKQLEDVFATMAVAIAATGDTYCATIVAEQAEPLADAWAELAKVNPRVKAIIEKALTGSAWGQVIFVTAATVIPIAAHHGLYPRNFPLPFSFGVGPPPPSSDEVKRQGETPSKNDGERGRTPNP